MKRIGKRLSPAMVLTLTGLWLLLNQTLAPGAIVLGVLLATVLTWAGSSLRPLRATLRRLDVAAMLMLVVIGEIVRSNIGVARIVLGLVRGREIRSGFLRIPLDLRDPHGLAALAVIVTSTPGTVWVGISPDSRHLTLHVLDLNDEQEWIDFIKARYERPLMRIFE